MKIEVSPISKGRRSEKDGWVVRQTVEQLKQRLQELFRGRPIRTTVERHGTAILVLFASLILGLSAVTRWWSPTVLPMLAPEEPQTVLGLAWQVHAGIIAIAFAGLALLLQFSTQSLIAGHTIRGALFRRTYFRPILTYCLIADVGLALVTAWFSTPSAVVYQMFFTILGSLALIAFAYWQVLRVFIQPGLAEGVGQNALLDLLRQSADSDTASARRFETEVNVLRDNVHEAISSGASGRTREGMEIMRTLMGRAAETQDQASQATGQRLSTIAANVSYGREWEILALAMSDLISASSDTRSISTKLEIHKFLFDLLDHFSEMSDLSAVQSCLKLILDDWSANLSPRTVNGSQDQGYILLRLSEVTEFTLPKSGNCAFQESAMSLFADTFIKCAKTAVDLGDSEAAALAVIFLRQTFEFDSGVDRGDVFRRSREVGLLVLLAWILFRKAKQFSGSEIDRTAVEIESAIPQHNVWELARRVQESEDLSPLRWTWWEGTIRLNRRWFGFPTMPTYVNLAALNLALTRPFESPALPAENDVTLAQRFKELLSAITRGDFRNLEMKFTSQSLENVEQTVRRVLDEDLNRRRDILAQSPLNQESIERFYAALSESLVPGATPRLARILVDDAAAGVVRKVRQRWLTEKSFFVASDVNAEPEELAQTLAWDMIREEEEAMISTILGAAAGVEVPTESIHDNLSDWFTSIENGGVIVTNSWEAYHRLIPNEQFERLVEGDLLRTASGIAVVMLYDDDRSPFVAAFSTPRGVRCKLSLPTIGEETSSGFVIDNAISVGVRELIESDQMAFTTDTGTSQNEYRAMVLIEASEDLTVEVSDSSCVRVWTLITEYEQNRDSEGHCRV